jgi:anthranilate phosphoribosyltransferase
LLIVDCGLNPQSAVCNPKSVLTSPLPRHTILAMDFSPFLRQAVEGRGLSSEEAFAAMNAVMDGEVSPVRLAAFLVAMRLKGETPAEIAGFARAMRAHSVKISAPAGAIDTCGTGGDGSCTLNVSTLAALVAAAAGVPVAKHGNRSVSSSCGSADLLEKLGAKIDCEPAASERCLAQCGFAFLFAPRYHPAMKHAGPVRKELGLRTVFNLLGPLTNPAGVKRQVLGVYSPALLRPVAEALQSLGAERAMVVHGADGLDEISPGAITHFAELKDGRIAEGEIDPAALGLPAASAESLRVMCIDNAAVVARAVLKGESLPARSAVLLNAAAALVVAGRAADLREGLDLAGRVLASGQAAETLQKFIQLSRAGCG